MEGVRISGDAIGVASMEEVLNALNFFIVEQQKSGGLLCKKKSSGCMLFNYFNILILNVLRVRRDHVTLTFPEFKMRVYGMKDESLWDTKEFKMRVYGMKDESLWDTKEFKMRV